MRILDRYLGRTVLAASATVIAALVAAFTFFTFLEELNDVGKGGYTILGALQFVLLRIPGLAYQLFPIAALLGALMGLGGLLAQGEMVAIRAAGVSLGRTIFAVMKAALLLMVVAMLIGELLVPRSEQMATTARSLALTDQIALRTRNGFWARDGQSFINIRSVRPDGRVEGIYIYEFDKDNRLRVSTYARTAVYRNQRWVLNNIEQTTFNANDVSVQKIPKAAWDSLLRPELIDLVIIDPDNLSMWDLVGYIRYLRENAQSTLRYEQALWSKVVYPLATGAMVFLAVPLVFASARVTTVGGRIVIGALVGIGFNIFNQAAGHLGVVFNLSPVVSVLGPTLLVVAIGFLLLRRVA
jgi:lipopolysaccharide export system permease protein